MQMHDARIEVAKRRALVEASRHGACTLNGVHTVIAGSSIVDNICKVMRPDDSGNWVGWTWDYAHEVMANGGVFMVPA